MRRARRRARSSPTTTSSTGRPAISVTGRRQRADRTTASRGGLPTSQQDVAVLAARAVRRGSRTVSHRATARPLARGRARGDRHRERRWRGRDSRPPPAGHDHRPSNQAITAGDESRRQHPSNLAGLIQTDAALKPGDSGGPRQRPRSRDGHRHRGVERSVAGPKESPSPSTRRCPSPGRSSPERHPTTCTSGPPPSSASSSTETRRTPAPSIVDVEAQRLTTAARAPGT